MKPLFRRTDNLKSCLSQSILVHSGPRPVDTQCQMSWASASPLAKEVHLDFQIGTEERISLPKISLLIQGLDPGRDVLAQESSLLRIK